MGLKERRERERVATRENILAGVRRIAQTEGWSALTIRKIANHIEYSPSMVYEYFSSKEDILVELFHMGFSQLATDLHHASAATDDADERAMMLTDAFWNFGQQHPDLYQLMHGLGGVSVNTPELRQPVDNVIGIIEDALKAWANAKGIILEDLQGKNELLWCVLHGLVSANMVDRIDGGSVRAHALARQAIRDFLRAWDTSAAK